MTKPRQDFAARRGSKHVNGKNGTDFKRRNKKRKNKAGKDKFQRGLAAAAAGVDEIVATSPKGKQQIGQQQKQDKRKVKNEKREEEQKVQKKEGPAAGKPVNGNHVEKSKKKNKKAQKTAPVEQNVKKTDRKEKPEPPVVVKSGKKLSGKKQASKKDKKSPTTQEDAAGQKRKIPSEGPSKKLKKKQKRTKSESDSDADDYMDQFFQGEESEGDDHNEMPEMPVFGGLPAGSSEEDSDFDVSESDSEDYENMSDSEEEDNAMSFEELMDYYGKNRDREQKAEGEKKASAKKKKTKKTESDEKPHKTGKVKKKSSTSSGNGWIEEDNDVKLEYKDSDGEEVSKSQALVPAGDIQVEELSSDDQDYSPEESVEDEEIDSDEDDLFPFEMESDSDDDDDDDSLDADFSHSEDDDLSGKEEDDQFGSDMDGFDYDDSDDDDLSGEEEEDDDDEYPSYWDDSYDSDEDGDYEPQDDDDLYIRRGEAKIYEIDSKSISFSSESAQIIELPCDGGDSDVGRKSLMSATEAEEEDGDEDGDDRESCPELVPIYDSKGRLIDSLEQLKAVGKQQSPRKSPTKPQKSSKKNAPPSSNGTQEQPKSDDAASPPVSGKSLLLESTQPSNDAEMEVDAPEEDEEASENIPPQKRSSFCFYDSIDMRMSLLILKDTLYFNGHLTIQPLIGGLEVMGYPMRAGECRSVFAARGFHSLNLSPQPEGPHYVHSREVMDKVLARVERHFQDADLKEIGERFDPTDSVLVLLQADCNNKRIGVVDKYMEEDNLFPRVEFLKKGPFFTSEYLLNAEFHTEYVDKNTAFYQSDPQWEKVDVKKSSKVMVMGGKGAGKSTLCQYLINKAVAKFKKVVLIDLDIGQPIQHIPETVSVTVVTKPLLGVATFDPVTPEKSWLFGSLDVVSSPIFYIQNVRQLVKYCQQNKSELANIPWIINTMGYVTGFGEELMAAVLRMFSPTDVIQLESTNKSLAIPNFKDHLTADLINQYNFNILRDEIREFSQRKLTYKHHPFNVCYTRKGFTLNAPKRRALMLLAHLANILNDTSSEWFNEVRPFSAPLEKLKVLITREDQPLGEDQLPSVLNATLVYLCRTVDGGLYECLGVGIVRGVDKNNNGYLLQSLPGEKLADVSVLAICSSSLPNAVFLRQSARIQGSIPYVYNVE